MQRFLKVQSSGEQAASLFMHSTVDRMLLRYGAVPHTALLLLQQHCGSITPACVHATPTLSHDTHNSTL